MVEQVMPAVRRVQERLLAPLSPAGRTAMVRMLGEIAQVHNEPTPAPRRVVAQR